MRPGIRKHVGPDGATPAKSRVKANHGRGASDQRRNNTPDLFATTADGVMAVDLAGRILLWNRSAEGLLGYSAAEVLGRRCYRLLQGRDDRGNILCHSHCHVRTMAKNFEPVHAYDLCTHRKDGDECWLNVSTVLLREPRGAIVVHLFRDLPRVLSPQPSSQALRQVEHAPPASAGNALPASLTRRQREILRLLASGESTRAIARRFVISVTTVRNHAQHILTKLGVHSRAAAVALAVRSGVADQPPEQATEYAATRPRAPHRSRQTTA